MSRRRWLQISVRIPPSYQDLLIGLLAPLGFTGFIQDERSFSGFLPRPKWTTPLRMSFHNLLSRFRKEFPAVDVVHTVLTLKEQNWNSRWERSVKIVEATDRILIKPSWRKLRKKDRGKTVLRIDPKMSFGTGHHETTRLCLALLEEHMKKGMRVLDVGSGTGILAIAAAKLGASSAVALDNDAWAAENGKENVRNNGVRGVVRVIKGDVRTIRARRFDLILCNIDLPTLTEVLPALIKRLRQSGIMILSGLLSRDLPALLDSLKNKGIVPLEVAEENEWAAIGLVKTDAR